MIAEIIYSVDWNLFPQLFVPGAKKPKQAAVFRIFLSKIKELHTDFLLYRNESIYKVRHNASVGLLEKMLNDKFDPNQRRIYINNVQRAEDLRVYSFPEEKEIGVRTDQAIGIRTGNNFNPDSPDFNVFIPLDIQPVQQIEIDGLIIRIKAQLDYYKLYAKKYELVWIN